MKPRQWFATVCFVLGVSQLWAQAVAVGAATASPGTNPVPVVQVATTNEPPRSVIPVPAHPDARITNLSTRARVTGESPLMVGFAISGSAPCAVLVRAVGPALRAFGVTDTVAAPRLRLYDGAGVILTESASWQGDPALAQAAAIAGAFPFPSGGADAAMVVTLSPGTYSVAVSDDAGRGGVVLVEIYDVLKLPEGSRLTNGSARHTVAPGGDFISGFVVAGTTARQFLIRGVGPALTRFNVPSVLRDPALTLFDVAGESIGANDNWSGSLSAASVVGSAVATGATSTILPSSTTAVPVDSQSVASAISAVQGVAQSAAAASVAAPLATAATRAGAFGLEFGSADAAMVVTLNPGAYTLQVGSATSAVTADPATSSGAALIEIYELP